MKNKPDPAQLQSFYPYNEIKRTSKFHETIPSNTCELNNKEQNRQLLYTTEEVSNYFSEYI
jgi:hypothetical protein